MKFCEETKASQLINSHFFRALDAIDEDTYEVQSCKKSINLNLPLQIGYFVYQYAKPRMLQFYYDFQDKFLDRSDFQYCEMDTDSAYIAISGQSVEQLVKPELRNLFQQEKITGSLERIQQNISLMIREHRGYLKRNGQGREL